MRRQLAARFGKSVIVVLTVTTICFFLIRLAPGDPFSYESPNFTPAVRAQLRQQFGYDRPPLDQFVRYISNVARGNFGYSHSRHQPAHQKAQRLVLEFAHPHHADTDCLARDPERSARRGSIFARRPASISSFLTRIGGPRIKELDMQVGDKVGWLRRR